MRRYSRRPVVWLHEGKTPHLYFVTLFVTPQRIQVLEIGGTKELMTANATQIDSAVTNFAAN